MTLTSEIVADPDAPAAVLDVLAEKAARHIAGSPQWRRDWEDYRAVRRHPNLNLRHPYRLGSDPARGSLAAIAGNADAPAGAVALAVELNSGRTSGRRMTRTVARYVARHPNAPRDLAVEALRILLGSAQVRERDVGWLVTAALRHPEDLADLLVGTRDPQVAAQLRRYLPGACGGALLDTRAADVIASAKAAGTPDAWRSAIRDAPLTQVVSAAVLSNPTAYITRSVLHAGFCSRELRGAAVTAAMSLPDKALRGELWLSHGMLNELPREVLPAYATMSPAPWRAAGVPVRADLHTEDLRTLWGALHANEDAPGRARIVEAGVKLALHPAADGDLRAAVAKELLDFGCSSEADNVKWFSAATALRILDVLEADGRTAAGRAVPVAVVNGTSRADLSTYRPLVREVLAQYRERFADAVVARAFFTIAQDFPGTLGELLDSWTGVLAAD